jgi:rubredoxin
MAKSELIRILVKGGILTPGYFIKIMDTAKKSGNTSLKFGSRQDILFEVPGNRKIEAETSMQNAHIDYEWKGIKDIRKQNIVSTFVTSGILDSTNWLTEGTYLKILEQFNYAPQITINIVDSKQNLQPLFNGMLNFISSATQDYWFLYFNISNKLTQLPFLVNSSEIPIISKYCELLLIGVDHIKGDEIVNLIESDIKIKKQQISSKLSLPSGFFPYYEGIEKMLNGKNYWAGFYWRNNNYDIKFIEKVCNLCLEIGIAKISITPWKTFLIKDIKPEFLPLWEQLIGWMGINMRHSSFELNWHLPVMDKAAFDLKKFIVKELDKVDVRTFGLSFSISKKHEPVLHASIRIIKNEPLGFLRKFNFLVDYTVELANNYNPNSLVYNTYAQNITRHELPGLLIELCKGYYLFLRSVKIDQPIVSTKKELIKQVKAYQCCNCLSIYSELVGDEASGIKPGILFKDLPIDYKCPTCESAKSAFVLKEMAENYLLTN